MNEKLKLGLAAAAGAAAMALVLLAGPPLVEVLSPAGGHAKRLCRFAVESATGLPVSSYDGVVLAHGGGQITAQITYPGGTATCTFLDSFLATSPGIIALTINGNRVAFEEFLRVQDSVRAKGPYR